MGFLHNLRLWLFPRRIIDPELGRMLFMHISNAPERSYWECECVFPITGTVVEIFLPGGESGPMPEARQFFLGLPPRFESILTACRPKLEPVFKHWLQQSLPQDIFTAVKLTAFGLEDPKAQPVCWDVSFETMGEVWLAITIPFVGEIAQEAEVDT